MKNSGMIAAMAIFIGLGTITMSCEKEQLKPEQKVKTSNEQAKDGGDDDDDPVIRGKVKKSNGLAVDNASVETFDYETDDKLGTVYTDELGDYSQKVPAGIYYLKVTNPNSNISVYTDTIHVHSDVIVNVTAD
jgi:hypothetical protein